MDDISCGYRTSCPLGCSSSQYRNMEKHTNLPLSLFEERHADEGSIPHYSTRRVNSHESVLSPEA